MFSPDPDVALDVPAARMYDTIAWAEAAMLHLLDGGAEKNLSYKGCRHNMVVK